MPPLAYPPARRALPLLALLSLLVAGCGGAPEPRTPPILVVTIDTIRADHMGAYGYFRDTSPHFDALAEEGVLFRRAVTTMATTLPAHLSLWASRYPLQTGVLSNGNRFKLQKKSGATIRLFAEMLQEAGYDTAAFVSATPVKQYTGIGVGFDHYDEPETTFRRAAETTDRALAWLAQPRDQPFLLWVHYFDPHKEWDPPPPYDTAFSTDAALVRSLHQRKFPDPTDPEIQQIHNLYDGEILYTDAHLGRLIERLRQDGTLARAAVVVVGDHGEGLGQHDHLTHGEIYNEQLFVPLAMRFPDELGLNGQVVEGIVSMTDVVPTLVAALDLPVSEADREQFAGVDTLGGEARRYAFAQRVFGTKRYERQGEKYALVGREWKYFYSTRRPDALYDLRGDFAESVNLIGVYPEIAGEMKAQLLAELKEYADSAGEYQVEQETSEEVLRDLRALGYIQ
ncbi:MAG: sulfatase [Thermoanaerobaculia bacterium]|nr:sulfatase [Thermoanaerobaculia bacterium]